MAELIQQGGPRALMVLYLAGPALVMALIHAVSPRSWAWWGGCIAAVLMLAIGIYGYVEGRGLTDHGVEMMSQDARNTPDDVARMREDGYREALRPLQFAGVAAAACAIPLLVGQLRRRRRTA